MTERAWTIINVVGAVAAIVGTATGAWRDWHEAQQARVRSQLDALDLRQRQQPQPTTERDTRWVDL